MIATLDTNQKDMCLCRVRFEADPADPGTYMIEAVYKIHRPAEDDFTIEGDPYFMERLSITRMDTREPITLSPDVLRDVQQAVMSKVTGSKLWGID